MKNLSNRQRMIEITTQQTESFQNGILGLLNKIELDKIDDSLKEDIKSIYQLLNLLNQVSTTKSKTI